jgi:hypothetical protein
VTVAEEDEMPKVPQRPPQPPPLPGADPYDGMELTDDDLEVVVGGVDPEYWMAQASYLQEMWNIKPNG